VAEIEVGYPSIESINENLGVTSALKGKPEK
jgi:hypothetical protein